MQQHAPVESFIPFISFYTCDASRYVVTLHKNIFNKPLTHAQNTMHALFLYCVFNNLTGFQKISSILTTRICCVHSKVTFSPFIPNSPANIRRQPENNHWVPTKWIISTWLRTRDRMCREVFRSALGRLWNYICTNLRKHNSIMRNVIIRF